jgi:hypothetical protein
MNFFPLVVQSHDARVPDSLDRREHAGFKPQREIGNSGATFPQELVERSEEGESSVGIISHCV